MTDRLFLPLPMTENLMHFYFFLTKHCFVCFFKVIWNTRNQEMSS